MNLQQSLTTEDPEMWQNHFSFCFLTRVRSSLYSPMAAWIFLWTPSLVTWSLNELFNSLREHLISKACILFSNSAVKVHDSQAYRNVEMTRIWSKRYVLISPNWLQLCKSCSGLCNPWNGGVHYFWKGKCPNILSKYGKTDLVFY